MKSIYNWGKATVFDLESDALLEEATKLHIMGWKLHGKEINTFHGVDQFDRIIAMFKWHIDNKIPVVCHNGIMFDIPLLEKLSGEDLSELMVIDTLALSWYLNIDRARHGLDHFLDDYGVKKPEIDDWENLSYEEYKHRVKEDVKINHLLWEDLKSRLIDMYTLSKTEIDAGAVGGKRVSDDETLYIDSLVGLSVEEHINRILTFLMFKMDCIALQEKTKWQVDVEYLEKSYEELSKLVEDSKRELESVMPKIPKYVKRSPPKNPFKKNGELSVSGQAWEERKGKIGKVDENGNPLAEVREVGFIHELIGYDEPNADSHSQIKDFLFSKGWVPRTFKYVRDKSAFEEWQSNRPSREGSSHTEWKLWQSSKPEDREVPQVNIDEDGSKELCESVLELAEDIPEIKSLENYSTIISRLRVIKGRDGKGWLNNLIDGKFLKAGAGGFSNTLRMKHRGITNLPKSSKPFSEFIRGSLVAGEGKISIGSDLSSLEDRIKHHFMIPHDPEYVSTMMDEDYDPHLATALASGFISKDDIITYKTKSGTESEMQRIGNARASGKTLNYALVYGSGVATIVRGSSLSVEEATAGREGYWELNWSVKAIADEQVVIKDSRGYSWLINPINGFLYNIRSEKDKFSTLAQGTGSFMFDMWVDRILTKMEEKWGRKTLTAQFHK